MTSYLCMTDNIYNIIEIMFIPPFDQLPRRTLSLGQPSPSHPPTVGENSIATNKIRNNIVHLNVQYYDSNIELFSIASCKVITLNPLSILFGISSLFLFLWLSL